MAQTKPAPLTRQLSKEIDAACEPYKANEPDALKRLVKAFVAQARKIARAKLADMSYATVPPCLMNGAYHGRVASRLGLIGENI